MTHPARRHFVPLPRLAVRSLPVVAAVVAVKWVLEVADVHLLRPNPLLSGVVAATVFLLGFLLAGTMTDYKESERLPGDVAASLESVADELLIAHSEGVPGAAAGIDALREVARGVVGYARGTSRLDDVLGLVRALNEPFRVVAASVQPSYVNRVKTEQANVRRMLLRIDTIKTTSFVAAGYTITELTGVLLVVGLVISDLGRTPEAVFFTGMITLLLTYMFLLIRDLDDPFRYDAGVAGAADVSLQPLEDAVARLTRAYDEVSGTAPAAPTRRRARGR